MSTSDIEDNEYLDGNSPSNSNSMLEKTKSNTQTKKKSKSVNMTTSNMTNATDNTNTGNTDNHPANEADMKNGENNSNEKIIPNSLSNSASTGITSIHQHYTSIIHNGSSITLENNPDMSQFKKTNKSQLDITA